ncbi:VanZ family protein [Halobacillus sp. BBL2006]|uniref:VanZ family protein n=1 Tax=Halobacillus sp. BBL2006 TaxID=1543706 RepID=UPI000541EECB|nr:VanZ family protein [Halobacillus sp. BBL2006]KHE71940.1 hypothetical protein LD39_07145 [Halobacillus sp. BBL2006]
MKRKITISFLISQILYICLFPLWSKVTDYLNPFSIFVVWLCFSLAVLWVSGRVLKTSFILSPKVLHSILLLYSGLLIVLLFFRPTNQSLQTINLIPFETIQLYLSGNGDRFVAFYNLAANVALFIPFGIYFRLMKKDPRLSHIVIIATLSICLIEFIQFLTSRGSLDIDDLILNLLGVVLGYILSPIIGKVFIFRGKH